MLQSEFWLHAFRLVRVETDAAFDLALDVGDEESASEVLFFRNVKNLRVSLPGSAPAFLYGFYVEDVRDRGLEGIRYFIRQAEQEALEFDCFAFERK